LVRYAAKYEFLRGKDIFVGLYLAKQPGAENVEWAGMQTQLVESLRREGERYHENGNGEDTTE
jgi:hypothetical protein